MTSRPLWSAETASVQQIPPAATFAIRKAFADASRIAVAAATVAAVVAVAAADPQARKRPWIFPRAFSIALNEKE